MHIPLSSNPHVFLSGKRTESRESRESSSKSSRGFTPSEPRSVITDPLIPALRPKEIPGDHILAVKLQLEEYDKSGNDYFLKRDKEFVASLRQELAETKSTDSSIKPKSSSLSPSYVPAEVPQVVLSAPPGVPEHAVNSCHLASALTSLLFDAEFMQSLDISKSDQPLKKELKTILKSLLQDLQDGKTVSKEKMAHLKEILSDIDPDIFPKERLFAQESTTDDLHVIFNFLFGINYEGTSFVVLPLNSFDTTLPDLLVRSMQQSDSESTNPNFDKELYIGINRGDFRGFGEGSGSEVRISDKPIEIPDTFTLQDKTMRLTSIVCHRGDASGGHYISYIRKGEQWYLIDDLKKESVLVNFGQVLESAKTTSSIVRYSPVK